jgi:hypothetical protein
METTDCTTCDGQGQSMMRGESHRDYDDPDYMDTCGICGGSGQLPLSMFAADDTPGEDDDADGWDRNGAFDGFQVVSDADPGL